MEKASNWNPAHRHQRNPNPFSAEGIRKNSPARITGKAASSTPEVLGSRLLMSSSPSKPFPHRSPRLPLLFLLSFLSFVSLFRRVPAYGALLHAFPSSFPHPLDFAPAWVLSPPSLSLSSSLLLISPLLLLLLKRYLLPPLLLTLRRLLTSRILPSLYSQFLPPPKPR